MRNEETKGTSRSRIATVYAALLVLLTGAVVVVRQHPNLVHIGGVARPQAPHEATLAHVLLALAVVTLFARIVGVVAQRTLRQPPVLGEILAGIALGPSLFAAIAPGASAFLFPAAVVGHLGVISKIGVVLFMFLVGLELDVTALRANAGRAVAIAHTSMVFPLILGAILASVLYPIYSSPEVPYPIFAAFVGVSLSVTAFPVLARILADRGLTSTPLGRLAIGCAALDDVTAWCLLALVSGAASAGPSHGGRTVLFALAYLATMFFVVRPLALAFARRAEAAPKVTSTHLAIVCAALLLSAVATETIGVHALFGSFLLGALIPHESRLATDIHARIEDLVVVLLLPVFFAFSGLRTEITLVSSARDLGFCALVIAIATVGKLGGTFVAARFLGLPTREAASLGVLMNTRGLMELIVLNVGLDAGVLSRRLFTILVLMALVTTLATAPLLDLVRGRNGERADA